MLTAAQIKLQQYRETLEQHYKSGQPDAETIKQIQEKVKRSMFLVNGVAVQLFFAPGDFGEKHNKNNATLSQAQLRRFWQESMPLFTILVNEPHPHTAHYIVRTLYHLLPCAPREVFLLAAKSICVSAKEAGFQHESLAVGDVVKFIQRTLADHRDLFQHDNAQESECFRALLEILDLFVEAGWPEARQLTHRLEEIYR